MTEQQVILTVVAVIIFAILLIVFYVLRVVLPAQYREKMTSLANENTERMALIERNMDPSLADKKSFKNSGTDALGWGLALAGIGLGSFLGYMISYYSGMEKKTSVDALGLLFGGLGLITFYFYRAKNRK